MKLFTKKKIAVLASLLVAAVAAIGAWAYFTANGSGSGSATVGTSSNLTLHGSTTGTLYPGTTVSISFTVDNPGSGTERLGTIYLAGVKACTGSGSSCATSRPWVPWASSPTTPGCAAGSPSTPARPTWSTPTCRCCRPCRPPPGWS